MKAYIAIFYCKLTHALHLEPVEDSTSKAFIGAFYRFTTRRGHCSDLQSDQGTNFIGADSCLQKLFEEFLSENSEVLHKLTSEGTKWHLNPPSAPHFGGLWEAAVRSAKKHLRRVVGEQILTFSELATVLCRIEAVLNSRPILPISDDISDLTTLTPAHFLIQRNSFLVPVPDLTKEKVPIGKRWENVTQMVQQFWNRWSKEYLTTLQQRNKWTTPQTSLQRGDLVFITSETTPPGKWPMGLVTATFPGKDGHTRVAELKTVTTSLVRPVVKLCLLRNNEDLTG